MVSYDVAALFISVPIHILNARVKGHIEPTHLKSSPLFTFSTKLLGQDLPPIHLLSKIIGSRFTTAKIRFQTKKILNHKTHVRSRFTMLQILLSEDSPCPKIK